MPLPSAAVEPLTGLQPFRRDPAVEVMRQQNAIAPLSRRIVLSTGLRGDADATAVERWKWKDINYGLCSY